MRAFPWQEREEALSVCTGNTWVSWVPTISGRLSFSLIGENARLHHGELSGVNVVINEKGQERRLFFIHQRRYLGDWLALKWLHKKGKWDFFFIGQARIVADENAGNRQHTPSFSWMPDGAI